MANELQLTDDVRDLLQRAIVAGNTLKIVEQLDRKRYLAVNKALELMGGKWQRHLKCHVFEGSAEDAVSDALATGTILDVKKAFQFFPTPPEVAERIVDMADVVPGMRVLEPSAGNGVLVHELRRKGAVVYICELQKDLAVALSSVATFIDFDFLKAAVDPRFMFDRIVANPPFSGGQDMAHVRHMYDHLAPGGRLVSVMSPAWRFREAKKYVEFREWAAAKDAQWEPLPAGSFIASGTNVNTGVITIDKAG